MAEYNIFEADRSLAQNIDRDYFAQDTPLKSEFNNLCHALFSNADRHNETATRKAAHTTLVTTFGLKRNEHSSEVLFQLTMNDLF
jgi:hypothetical protein